MKPLVENIPRSLENSLSECCHCNCIGLPCTWLFYVCGFAVRYILCRRKVGNRHLGELVPLLTFSVNKRLRYASNLPYDVPFVRNALSMCKDGGWETWREKSCVGVRKISGKMKVGWEQRRIMEGATTEEWTWKTKIVGERNKKKGILMKQHTLSNRNHTYINLSDPKSKSTYPAMLANDVLKLGL